MAGRPRISDYRGNWLQRFGRYMVDRGLPGNQRAPDGTLQHTPRGLLGLGVKGVMSTLGPAGTLAGGQFAENIGNNINPFNFQGNNTRLGRFITGGPGVAGKFGGGISGPTFQPIGIPGVQPPDLATQLTMYRPNLNAGNGAINPEAIPLDTSVQVDDVKTAIPAYRPNLQQGGGPSNQLAAGVGRGGAQVIWNDSWGDAARGFGIGATSGNGPSTYAIADAMKTAQYLRQ